MRVAGAFVMICAISGAFALGLTLAGDRLPSLCVPDEPCVREWLAATSGWAAVIAAVLTVLYMHRQVRDAERHQRAGFAIQVRKQRILAVRISTIAQLALEEINKQEMTHRGSLISAWDRETVGEILHHLRDTSVSTFESEVAHPSGLGAWGTALAIESGVNGAEPAVRNAASIARQYFGDLRDQADAYLVETAELTGTTSFNWAGGVNTRQATGS